MSRPKRTSYPDTQKRAAALGRRLQLARRRRGMSADETAARVLVSRPTISRLEHGDLSVSFAVLARYLDVLGQGDDLDQLLARDETGEVIADARLGRPRRPSSRGLADEL